MDIENATYAQLLYLRRSYRQDLAAIEAKIAEHRTRQLFVRKQKQNEVLQQVNREFFNFFGGDPFLNKKLMAPVRNMSFFISYGLNKRLNELGIFYVWQIMLRTEKYFQDHIGGKETSKLKNHLAENGLYPGMRPNGTKQPRREAGLFLLLLFVFNHFDMQFVKLLLRNEVRRLHHQILRLAVQRE